jgi:hypothetical protein
VPYEMKDDYDMVLAALKKDDISFDEVPYEMKDDYGMVLAALKKDDISFDYVPKSMKDDYDMVLAALKKDDISYADDVPESMKDDYDMVRAAVKKGIPEALEYAAFDLRDNEDLILTAMKKCHSATPLKFASNRLRNDLGFISQVMSTQESQYYDGHGDRCCHYSVNEALQYVDDSVKKNRDFLLKLIKRNFSLFGHVPDKFRTDIEFVLKVIGSATYHDLTNDDGDCWATVCLDVMGMGLSRLEMHMHQMISNPYFLNSYLFLSTVLFGMSDVYAKKKLEGRGGTTSSVTVAKKKKLLHNSNQSCLLQMLNLDPHTGLYFKKEIASYLGIEFGCSLTVEEIRHLLEVKIVEIKKRIS